MHQSVAVSNVAKTLANSLEATHSDENKRNLLKLVITSFVYQFFALLVKYRDGKAFLEKWCREFERLPPFDLLALLLKKVPLVGEVKDIVKGLGLYSLSTEAVRELFEEAFNEDEAWIKFILSFFSSEKTYFSTVADITLLPLHWFLLYESKTTGIASYKLSGIGVYEGFKRGDLVKKPFVGFFTLIKTDPEASIEIRNAVRNYSCLSVKTVKVFGTGKLERLGTRRGSPISRENVIRGPEFQKVATTPFVPESKLTKFGGIDNLPFEFSLVSWGPITILTRSEMGNVLVSTEYPHPILPTLDWATAKILSVVNEIPYLPIATLVRSEVKVVDEVPLVWFYSTPSKKTRVILPSPRSIENATGEKGIIAIEFEISGTREKVVTYFPSTKARRIIGASALDAVRIPCEFAETILKKVERSPRELGVLLWLEPLIPTLDKITIPRWGIYFSTEPTEFTGGVESIYSQHYQKHSYTSLKKVRKIFDSKLRRSR